MGEPVTGFYNSYLGECRFIERVDLNPHSNFDGIKVIDSQVDLKCSGHSVNNLFQRRVIDVCDIGQNVDIDQAIRYIKLGHPGVKVFSCNKTLAQQLLESDPTMTDLDESLYQSDSDYIYNTPETAYTSVESNLDSIIGFIEFNRRHYVCWVKNHSNGYWYRIDSLYKGGIVGSPRLGGTICKFSQQSMLQYIRELPEIDIGNLNSGFSGACRLLIVTDGGSSDLSGRPTVRDKVSRTRRTEPRRPVPRPRPRVLSDRTAGKYNTRRDSPKARRKSSQNLDSQVKKGLENMELIQNIYSFPDEYSQMFFDFMREKNISVEEMSDFDIANSVAMDFHNRLQEASMMSPLKLSPKKRRKKTSPKRRKNKKK